jgi:hypothetical protein
LKRGSVQLTQNLLAAHEKVVGVGDLWVLGVLEGVEGTCGLGELVEDVEVGVVLLADQGAEGLFLRRRHVLVVGHVAVLLGALLAEELLALGKGQADGLLALLGEQEVFGRVHGAHRLDVLGAALLEAAEDVQQDALEDVHGLVVGVLLRANLHLQIESGELSYR